MDRSVRTAHHNNIGVSVAVTDSKTLETSGKTKNHFGLAILGSSRSRAGEQESTGGKRTGHRRAVPSVSKV